MKLRLLAAALFLFTAHSHAQEASGRVIGVVSDAQGSVVPAVKVTVTNTATGISRETTSDAEGNYQVLQLPIGRYSVAAEKDGFRRAVINPQPLEINQSLRVDVRLEVGSLTEVVSVQSDAVGVETVNATIGHSVTSRPIVDLPLNGRNAFNLALLMPGVTESRPNSSAAGIFSVAGARTDSVTFLLDGGVNNNLLSNIVVYNPNPETLQEFRILANNYTAEYGRNAGGIVSAVTKSGTNEFHGSAYDYIRNEAFNANRFFNNMNDVARPVLKRHQLGGTLGGKIIANRLFFFGAYQRQLQNRVISNAAVNVFTPAELRGDFSASGSDGGPDTDVAGFLRANPFYQSDPSLAARAIIAPDRIDAIARRYIQANLLPSSSTGQVFSQGGAQDNYHEATTKVDWHPTERDRLSATFGFLDNPILTPFWLTSSPPGFETTATSRKYFGTLNYTRTFTPNLLNEFRFTPHRVEQSQAAPTRQLPTPTELGLRTQHDVQTGPPVLFFELSGLTVGFSGQGPTSFINSTYTFTDTLTWTRGSHNWKMGGYLSSYQNATLYNFYVNGAFSFGGDDTIGSANDRADFLLGLPYNYFQSGSAPSDIRTKSYSGFIQDEWRIARRLVLTLGLRYDYSEPKYDTQGRSFSIVPGAQSQRFTNAPRGLLFPGDPGAPKGSNFADKNDFAPRFGFAFDVFGNGRTSIRGGYGLFYDILKGEDNLQFNGQAPFFGFADLYFSQPGNINAPLTFQTDPFRATDTPNPFPSTPPPANLNFAAAGLLPIGGSSVYYVNPNLRTPYIHQYNLSIQQELMRNLTAEIAYVGSSSHKLTSLVDQNPMILGTNQRVLGSNFSFLDTFQNVVNANYNSLQAMLRKRYSSLGFLGNVDMTLSYTYAKSLDNASGFRELNSVVPHYNHKQFYGPSDFDISQRVSLGGIWDLPFGGSSSGFTRKLLGGWSVRPIVFYRTGFPLDVLARFSRTRTNAGPSGAGDPQLVRANLVKPDVQTYDPKMPQRLNNRSGNFWFDPTTFSTQGLSVGSAVPAAGARTYGTLGRNAFRGPTRFNTDVSVSKKTAVWGERVYAEIIGDFFNVFNQVNFLLPQVNIGSSLFGQVTTTEEPRIIQLAVRFTF